jgi:hypothetical protein
MFVWTLLLLGLGLRRRWVARIFILSVVALLLVHITTFARHVG